MKKTDLKTIIKPLVKECIHEVLLQEGLLSSVISEVLAGLKTEIVRESSVPSSEESLIAAAKPTEEGRLKIQEVRRKMLDAVGKDGYRGVDIFEGTTPLKSAGSPSAETPVTSPLAHMSPGDAGVDISSVFGGKMTSNWGKIVKGNK